MATWTWKNSNLTAASAKCFASDTNGHIIAGTTNGVYTSNQTNPGVWNLCSTGLTTGTIIAVASTADGTAMFAVTSTSNIYYSSNFYLNCRIYENFLFSYNGLRFSKY